jgi:hypothetical protein
MEARVKADQGQPASIGVIPRPDPLVVRRTRLLFEDGMSELATVEHDSFTVDTNTAPADEVRASLQQADAQATAAAATAVSDPSELSRPESASALATDADTDDASEAGKQLAARKRSLEGRKQTIQSQINDLVRQRGETQRERDQMALELAALRAERAQLTQAQAAPTADDGAPKIEQFQDYDQYDEARVRYLAQQEAQRLLQHTQQQQQAYQRDVARAQWQQQRDASFAQRLNTYVAEHPEFATEVDREDIVLTQPIVDVIKGSPVAPALMLHIANYPEDVQRIQALHPVLAYGEMKALEARLEVAATPASTRPSISQARPPIRPVGSTPSGSADDASSLEFGSEYVRRMNAADRSRRRRW